MVNTDEFIKRLEIILDYYNLNASSFADKIGVQRSSMSHLLSGRNKPSLDFILKIIDFFPEVDLYWILKGAGFFPKNSAADDNLDTKQNFTDSNSDVPAPLDLFSQISAPIENKNDLFKKTNEIQSLVKIDNKEEIEKIIFFYKNGTFKMFTPDWFSIYQIDIFMTIKNGIEILKKAHYLKWARIQYFVQRFRKKILRDSQRVGFN